MNTLFYAFLLVSLVAIGEAIKCHYCVSRVSYEDCDANSKKVQCLYHVTACSKAHLKDKGTKELVYVKGCPETCNKDALPGCNDGSLHCEIHCCNSDYCNAGSSLSASVSFTVLVTAAGTVALIFGKMI